jgi:hypothetical protein
MQNIVGPIAKMLSKRTRFALIEKNARGDTKQRDFFLLFLSMLWPQEIKHSQLCTRI